jgi:8-oxo-dGTP diphosphatase
MTDAPRQHAAGIFPVYPGGAVLLQLRDDRPDVAAPNCWSTVGGHIEPGETPPEAAAREMEEETGRRPATVIPAGFIDHPSASRGGIIVRSHMFATLAPWSLDAMILGEGQRLDWFPPAEIPSLRLGSALAPAVLGFLDSPIHRTLAGDVPPIRPPLTPPLPDALPDALELLPDSLVAVEGVSAGFVRRLAGLRPNIRVTASPSDAERPGIGLWQPRRAPSVDDYARWCTRLLPNGVLWQLASGRSQANAPAHLMAEGFTRESWRELPGGFWALRLRRSE